MPKSHSVSCHQQQSYISLQWSCSRFLTLCVPGPTTSPSSPSLVKAALVPAHKQRKKAETLSYLTAVTIPDSCVQSRFPTVGCALKGSSWRALTCSDRFHLLLSYVDTPCAKSGGRSVLAGHDGNFAASSSLLWRMWQELNCFAAC